MSLKTLSTTVGFLKSLLVKYLPLHVKSEQLSDIFNYLKIDDRITTSGQPTQDQFVLIKKAGFANVINLAPHDAENSLTDEAGELTKLNINYIHIPVDFKKPTDSDFKKFQQIMQQYQNKAVWVHCAANMRVSAFVYRYRRDVLNAPVNIIKKDLDKIWRPFGVWKKFLAE